MTTLGLFIMIAALSTVVGLMSFCFYKIFSLPGAHLLDDEQHKK